MSVCLQQIQQVRVGTCVCVTSKMLPCFCNPTAAEARHAQDKVHGGMRPAWTRFFVFLWVDAIHPRQMTTA